MKQKSMTLLLTIALIFSLSGCFIKPEPENEIILKYTDKEIIDVSDSYTVEDDSIPMYRYLDDDTVSYVDIEEFVSVLNGGIIYYNVSKDEELKILLRQAVPDDASEVIEEEYVDYEIVFNHTENTIYANDVSVFDRLNLIYSVATNDTIHLSSITDNNVDKEVLIDLDDYDFDILSENDHYYMPLYLANLFLSGATVNFYEMDDSIIVFEYGTDVDQVIDNYESSGQTLQDVQDVTNNYLALYFDYFYGLKEDKEIDSFYTYFEEYNLDQASNFIDYFESINNAFIGLDDLHTRVTDSGYLLPDHVFNEVYDEGSKVDKYSTAYAENRCRIMTDEFEYTQLDEDTHLYTVTRFESDTGDLFKETMANISPGDDVVIDITCNTGGSLQGVVELMLYLTDQDIPVRHIHSKFGQISEEFYFTTEESLEDYNLYVITSQVTYSAANVFASMVQDLEVGLLIGDHTLGGSSALLFTVLPNGMIISNSSYMTFLDEDFDINEDGFDVDIDYGLPYFVEDLPYDLDSVFKIGTTYVVEAYDFLTRSVVSLTIASQDDDISAEYVLNVYDNNGTLAYTETFYDPFISRRNYGESIYNFDVEIIANYEYEGQMYQEIIFFQEAVN